MLDGGNSYTLAYANHILKLSTNRSRFLQASEAIPFMGIVLHGASCDRQRRGDEFQEPVLRPAFLFGPVGHVSLRELRHGEHAD